MGIERTRIPRTIYLIKDLAVVSGHSVYTVNYYLNLGFLKEFARSPETNFRFFDARALQRLKLIRKLRKEGRSIKDLQKRFVR